MSAIRQPDLRLLFSHPAHFLSLGFGSGLAPRAPGTFGSLTAIPLYLLLAFWLSPLAIALLAIPLFVLGVWTCDKTGKALGVSDHGSIVWDEIVAMLPLLALAPQTGWGYALAFALFRVFDIWKPWPIRWFDARIKGGLGVMLDDALAAIPAAALLYGALPLLT
ncbi:phosphatidylglycerophosphatase A family protein [Chitinimonas sp. BJB300]|uniref:phosphatidylglycerophosphatase A family protein n=1 Tax=Chitinimonas sp. BJB300 TaxID=1559339 RepID=UPI000C115AEA|nr:phosphatidylglycerophosphatase A [Chitinimonas sp. BJB300]PHV09974.1 phosphatidylglycerophosphatase A [Chitinimonas sp. BJB300]TSJ87185.1 phosphatidylglycerophosphatase A [Chitinimonas sp. BJB300]